MRESIGMLCGSPHCGHIPELFHPGKRGRRVLLQLFPVMSDSLALLAGPAQGARRGQFSVARGNGMYMKRGGMTEWHELGLATSAIHRDLPEMLQKKSQLAQVDPESCGGDNDEE